MFWKYPNAVIDRILRRTQNPRPMTRIEDVGRPAEESGIGNTSNKEFQFKQMVEEVRMTKQELQKERTKNDQLKKKLERLERECGEAVQQARSLDHVRRNETARYQKTVDEQQRQVRAISKKHEQMSNLLKERSSELKAAQAFLSKADSISEADALQVVSDLNMQILQVAASLAEMVDGADPQEGPVNIVAFNDAKSIYGPLLVQELRHKDQEVLQVAFQACIIRTVWRITMEWGWYADLSFLNNIYAAVYASEEQSVAGRWRALTRTHVPSERDPTDDLIRHLTKDLAVVLLCTGLYVNHQEASNHVERRGGEMINAVVNLAIQLNKILRSEITSSDLVLFYGSTGMDFDQDTMEDYYGHQSGAVRGPENYSRVLGGTEFGVIKVVKSSCAGKSETIQSVLHKAKVVLESTLAPIKEEEKKIWTVGHKAAQPLERR